MEDSHNQITTLKGGSPARMNSYSDPRGTATKAAGSRVWLFSSSCSARPLPACLFPPDWGSPSSSGFPGGPLGYCVRHRQLLEVCPGFLGMGEGAGCDLAGRAATRLSHLYCTCAQHPSTSSAYNDLCD